MGQTTVEKQDIKAEVENTCGKPLSRCRRVDIDVHGDGAFAGRPVS